MNYVSRFRQATIAAPIIRENCGLRQDAFFGNAMKILASRILGGQCDCAALAFHYSNDALLMTTGASTATLRTSAVFAAEVALIHFYFFAVKLHVRIRKQRPKLFEHTPCRLIGNPGFPLNLLCRDAAAR